MKSFGKFTTGLMFFIGLMAALFEISLYRKTIISVYIPIAIIVLIGLISFLINKSHYKQVSFTRGNFFALLQNICSWGFIVSCGFMAVNYYFSDGNSVQHIFTIIEKSSMPGPKGKRNERQPLVTINYFDIQKELVFRYTDTEKVDTADKAILFVRKGALGFDILSSYDVK